MSRLRAVRDVLPTGELLLGADDLETMRAAIDWLELAKRGWDETSAVFKPAPDDPQFGYFSTGGRQPSEELCLVCRTPGHERPARAGGLCDMCARTARGRGQAVNAYIDGGGGFPPACPRPSFGRGGWINFGHLRQTWLREAAKAWCWERLPTFDNPARLAQIVFDLGPLSESLTRHRPDGGREPAVLSRADILAFCNDLAHLEATGRLSAYMRHRVQVDTDLFLRQCRSIRLTRPGAPMAGTAEDVAFSPSDRSARPRPPTRDEVGRSIPPVVLEQLLCEQALGRLEVTAGPDIRTMVELQARVGRRPGDLCGLVWTA
jgi:hypothetical protein